MNLTEKEEPSKCGVKLVTSGAKAILETSISANFDDSIIHNIDDSEKIKTFFKESNLSKENNIVFISRELLRDVFGY